MSAHLERKWGPDWRSILQTEGLLPPSVSRNLLGKFRKISDHIDCAAAVKKFHEVVGKRLGDGWKTRADIGMKGVTTTNLLLCDLEVVMRQCVADANGGKVEHSDGPHVETSRENDGCCECGIECALCQFPSHFNVDERARARGIAHDVQYLRSFGCPFSTRSPWVEYIRYASWTSAAEEEGEVLVMSVDGFEEIMEQDIFLQRPIRIFESCQIQSTPQKYAKGLELSVGDGVDISSWRGDRMVRIDADEVVRLCEAKVIRPPPHVLIRHVSKTPLPPFMDNGRFRRCRPIEARSSSRYIAGDRDTCEAGQEANDTCDWTYSLLTWPGSISSFGKEKSTRLYIQVVFGFLLLTFVPNNLMADSDWKRFGHEGEEWNPGSRAWSILLCPGDTFIVEGLSSGFTVGNSPCLMVVGNFMENKHEPPTDAAVHASALRPSSHGVHSSGARQKQAPLVEDVASQSNPSSRSDRYCEQCKGLCVVCEVPDCVDREMSEAMYEIAHNASSIEGITRNVGLQPYMDPIRFASLYTPSSETNKASPETSDAWVLTSSEFANFSRDGHVFTKPVIIKEEFPDRNQYSIESYASCLERTYAGMEIPVRSGVEPLPKNMKVSTFTAYLRGTREPAVLNALSLGDNVRSTKPHLTTLERYQYLHNVISRAKAKASGDVAGKQTESTPCDVESCLDFNVVGLRGAHSGPHMDVLGPTWLRLLWGTKLWWIVDTSSMRARDWQAFQEQGYMWDASPYAKAIPLFPNDVLYQGPGVIHAALTVTTALMVGSMIWDKCSMTHIVETIASIAEQPLMSNEPIPHQLATIIDALEGMISNEGDHQDLKDRLRDLRENGCSCQTCIDTCPCKGRSARCTPLCRNHSYTERCCREEDTSEAEIGSASGSETGILQDGTCDNASDSDYQPSPKRRKQTSVGTSLCKRKRSGTRG